jgi:hypothetical protein
VPHFLLGRCESLLSYFLFRKNVKYVTNNDYQMGFLKVKSPSRARQKIKFFHEAGQNGQKERRGDQSDPPSWNPVLCSPPLWKSNKTNELHLGE